jgi:dipeptidyl aminopeptidase/acylaminoacyl peptidase
LARIPTMHTYRDFQPRFRFQPTLAISPDGGRIAYVDDGSGQFNVAVRPVDGSVQRLTSFTDSTVHRVAWHPSGEWLLFLADVKGDENAQIFRVDAAGGEPLSLTHTPGVQHEAALGDPFSPDGTRIAYCCNDRSPGDQDILVRNLFTGEIRRVFEGGGRCYAGYWSPDGSRLTVAEWRTANSDHVIHMVAADGSSTTRLTPDGAASTYWLGPWLPDGTGFLVMSNEGREFTGLAVMDADTGKLTWLDTPDWEIEDVALSADGRVLLWHLNVDGASQLRGRDLAIGADLPVPALPTGAGSGLAISADGSSAVMRLSTPTRPWNIAMIDLVTGKLDWLTESTPVGANPVAFVEPTLLRYPTRDGCRIPAYVYRPSGAQEPVGVVFSIHGGPGWQDKPAYLYDGFYQYLVSRGIAVFAPNVRGSFGYGKAYQQAIYRDWGGIDLRDFADAVAFLRLQDWVNPERIGLFGQSYGGFCVLSCMSRLPELGWAAGVDLYGPSNLVTLAKASPPTWRSLVAAMIGDPEADAKHLISRSPVTHAENIRAPLMVIQGANDPRVPQSESEQIVARLRARDVEVRYDVYPDEGHGFNKRENQAKALADAGEFLLAHLGS